MAAVVVERARETLGREYGAGQAATAVPPDVPTGAAQRTLAAHDLVGDSERLATR